VIDFQTGRARLFIGLLGILAVTSCSDLGGPGPGHVEDPGILLVPATTGAVATDPVWTSDGSEVVYLTGGAFGASTGLNAVSISTHASRRIHSSSSIYSFVRGKSGERIYFTSLVTAGSGGQSLEVARLHPATGTVEVVTTVSIGADDHLEVSPDEKFLVIGSTLHNVLTGTSTALPRGRAVGFSPDGTQVLYYLLNSGSSIPTPVLIATADASSQALHSTGDFYLAHRWVGNSPLLLMHSSTPAGGVYSNIHLSEVDAVTGTTRDVADFTSPLASVGAAWSPDGNTLAAWIAEGSLADRTDRTTLYVIRSGGTPAVVGSIHGYAGPPVFSPSGTAIAYFYYDSEDYTGSLYVKTGI
jgi:Tol biopolymer transport system component